MPLDRNGRYDFGEIIEEPLAIWHELNPDALVSNLDATRIRRYMSGCSQTTITDAAFQYLHGIQNLDMQRCNQGTITPVTMYYLVGIKELSTMGCRDEITIEK